jgi:hypothetical protein
MSYLVAGYLVTGVVTTGYAASLLRRTRRASSVSSVSSSRRGTRK